jgi:hypothetical protein
VTYNLWLLIGAIRAAHIDCPVLAAAGASTIKEAAAICQYNTTNH